MSKSHKPTEILQTLTRREKGTSIPITTRHVTLPDGTAGAVHGINLQEAEIPDRHYLATACGVIYSNERLRLLFAQQYLDATGLRNLVIINMAPLAAVQFLQAIRALNQPSLDDIAQRSHIEKQPLIEIHSDAEEQTVELPANVIAAAFSGRDASLDFYHASVSSLAAALSTNRIALEPVVRINLDTSLVISLVARLEQLSADFPQDAKPWEHLHDK